MEDKESKGEDEVLVQDIGDTELSENPKSKKKKVILIIISIILLIVIAAIVVLIFILRKDDDKSEKQDDSLNDKIVILFNDSQIIKPEHTSKKYEIIQLKESKYKFILIHDPKTINGGIEIRSNLGFHTEIIDGFAHYTEHIFFGGTNNITELDLSNIISQFNEFLNAYTYNEETVFQIFGSNYTFDTILDYISNFIQRPKFNKTYLKTEINAVNSEYDTLNNTIITFLDILRDNSNPDHGFSQTITSHCGNKETLGNYTVDILYEYLKNYFNILFKPENTIFLLYSPNTIEEMRKYAQKYFDFILNEPTKEFNELFNKKKKALDNEIFLKGQLGKISIINKLRETSIMLILFQISQKTDYVEAIEILKFLFYRKDENSLIKFLYDNNYISSFDITELGYLKNYELIYFSIDLTKNGIKNINKIIEALFAAINVIKEDIKIDDIINNLKKIEDIKFKIMEEKRTILPDDIDKLLNNYHFFGVENMLGNPKIYTNKTIKEIFQNLTPDQSFILIDSNKEVNSDYITSSEILYTKNFKTPYKMNSIPEKYLNILKKIKSVDNYQFKIRTKNDDYTKYSGLTEKPCYEKESPYTCEYNEYDPIKNKTEYIPYTIQNSDNILSLMKIDRSYGMPFIKGYIKIELDKDKFKEYVNTSDTKAIYYLILNSFNYQFSYSSLKEGGTTIVLSTQLSSTIEITFSTYNDLLDKVIEYIINFFNNTIDELSFNVLKEKYYLQKAKNNDASQLELRNELLNIFMRFISVDTYEFNVIETECIKNSSYSDFKEMFTNIFNIKKQLIYLTNGDISLEQAKSTTKKLSSIINDLKINLKLNEKKEVNLPEKTSILYSLISSNIYQKQGVTLVMYEYDNKISEEMKIYSYCASPFFYDYIRTKRGSGYTVNVRRYSFLNKNYLSIYSLGSEFSPEKMDRLINEAIKESFNIQNCNVDLIRKHLKIKSNLNDYAQDKFEKLKSNINNYKLLKNEVKEEENMTYKSIVEKLQDVFINKPKRISILYHKGNITEKELEEQNKEMDENYYLNTDIKNVVTNNITYLEKYIKK